MLHLLCLEVFTEESPYGIEQSVNNWIHEQGTKIEILGTPQFTTNSVTKSLYDSDATEMRTEYHAAIWYRQQ